MHLTKKLKVEIADSIITTFTPVAFLGLLLCSIGIILFGAHQYQRLIPIIATLILLIPSWVYAKKGKPLTGILFILACIGMSILPGMFVSGGVHSLSYTGTLIAITIITVLYGKRGGILFIICTVIAGALFSLLIRQGILHRVDEPPTSYLLLFYFVLLVMQFVFVLIPLRLMARAINDRKQTRDEFQSILDKTPDIIYRLNAEGKITFINEAVRKYGYIPQNLLGKSLQEFVHPDDWPVMKQRIIERNSFAGGIMDIEVRLLKLPPESNASIDHEEDKAWCSFRITSDALYSDDTPSLQSFTGIQGIAHDISRIRNYEQQIDRLAAVVEQVAEDVVITDREGIIRYVNTKFEEVTGYVHDEVVGHTPRIFKSGRHDDAFYAELWKTITRGKIWKGRIWNRRKDGNLILQDITITPILDLQKGTISGYASVRRDITEQNRIQEQMQHSQKMEAIGTLAGGIAHDFNNILTGMMGYTELAVNSLTEDNVIKDMLQQVLEAGNRATGLVRQILSFSRSEKVEVRPVNLSSLTREVLKLIRASLPATIEIRHAINSESYIRADATKVHQILMNLCTNAAHAMREKGGILEVSLEEEHTVQDSMAPFSGVLPGKYLNLIIKDTGPGIPPDIIKKIFEPYFTTKAPGEGTGLGLSVVHGIVQEYGGKISVESEVGKGTTFSVRFPIIEKSFTSKSKTELPLSRDNEHILLVDDDNAIAEMISLMLKKLGYRVSTITSSIAALEAFRSDPGEYDLVFTDMTMPNMTGKELTKNILDIRPDIPVIICTGFSEQIDETIALETGICAFIMKPLVIQDVAEKVREVLDRKA